MIDCGPYFIFPVIGAALIRERRLFESGAYFSYGYITKGNIENLFEALTRYAQFNMKYVHRELRAPI